jgi:hypothetical protein
MNDAGDHPRQGSGSLRQFAALPCRDDRARDPARRGFLAVGVQNLREFAFLQARKEIVCGHAAARIHPHVQRTVDLEGETALGLIELHRGDAEIKEHAVDPPDTEFSQCGGDTGKTRVNEENARIAAHTLASVGVEIKGDNPLGSPLENCTRVPTGTEGCVDIDAAIANAEAVECFSKKNSDMNVCIAVNTTRAPW